MMDLDRFLGASFLPREATIAVPELSNFFGEETPEWTIRGLTSAELARANEISDRMPGNIRALVDSLTGDGDKAEAIRKIVGLPTSEVPADVSRRIEMLATGSVSPELGESRRDVAVRLAETFPTVFYNLTNRILSLTGQGAELGKRKRSGGTAA